MLVAADLDESSALSRIELEEARAMARVARMRAAGSLFDADLDRACESMPDEPPAQIAPSSSWRVSPPVTATARMVTTTRTVTRAHAERRPTCPSASRSGRRPTALRRIPLR
jgi:hypothetical protein